MLGHKLVAVGPWAWSAAGALWLLLTGSECRPSGESGDGEQRATQLSFGEVPKAPPKDPQPAAAKPKPEPRPYQAPSVPLGVNLGAVNYFATAIPFVDVMKMADPFASTNAQDTGRPEWDTGVAEKIPRDENGYPLEAPSIVPGTSSPQILRASVVAATYAGRYAVLWDGDGELDFPASPVQIIGRGQNRLEIDVEAGNERSLFLSIVRSNKQNHVRNIRVLLPGYERVYTSQTFHPTFLARLRGVGAVRFMDWGATNNHPLAHWSERTLPGMAQGGMRGVAYEYMIELANQIGADAWFCVPHRADDHYVSELAKLIKTKLDPKRRAYIEYSNELWNNIFEQAKWASDEGCKHGLNKLGEYAGSCDDDGTRYWAGIKHNARRSGQIFKIVDGVFGGETGRLVHVLAGQAQNDHLNQVLLKSFDNPAINTAKGKADVFAIAPYIGGSLAADVAEHGRAHATGVPELLEQLDKLVDSEVSEPTRKNKQIAEQHGLHLVAYEAGQHLVAYGPAGEDESFVNKLIAANRSPRMRSIYTHMLDAWYTQSDQGLLMLFNYVETPNKHGVWGLLEHQEQPLTEAPKYQAFFDRLQRLATRAARPPEPQRAASDAPPPAKP